MRAKSASRAGKSFKKVSRANKVGPLAVTAPASIRAQFRRTRARPRTELSRLAGYLDFLPHLDGPGQMRRISTRRGAGVFFSRSFGGEYVFECLA